MFKKDVWCYAAVDVQDDNGLIRHGMVIDLIEDGGDLIVDFGYTGHHAERIPLSRCVAFTNNDYRRSRVDIAVQFLSQRNPDQPWCWHPAKLVVRVSDVYSYALVEVDIDGQSTRVFVDGDRIRVTVEVCPLMQKAMLGAGTQRTRFYDKFPKRQLHFHKRRVELGWYPDVLAVARKLGFREAWNRLTNTMFVHFEAQQHQIILHYISALKRQYVMDAAKCKEYLDHIKRSLDYKHRKREIRIDACRQSEKQCKRQKMTADAGSGIRRSHRYNAQSLQGLTSGDASDETTLRYLPLEVLSEALSYLVVERKVMCVCRDWDALVIHSRSALIELEPLSTHINTTLAWMLYGTAVTWSISIRWLIVTIPRRHRCRFVSRHLVPVVHKLLIALRIKASIILLSYMKGAGYDDFLPPFHSEQVQSPWFPICKKLLLVVVELSLPSNCYKADVVTAFRNFGSLYGVWVADKWGDEFLQITQSILFTTDAKRSTGKGRQ
ncbi:uncharacterized protein LOC129595423 [Paramacrobiotus metropolitanus]|uniref:uncharacterized protein LOC129595423 n=1 Tax=Paramacrobiotus metropolitanus TaxID=2943436 RepID=UPI0024463437|nr:uncharacterized protein LOC129595423 [Paramacrobiotus metropolitanus]